MHEIIVRALDEMQLLGPQIENRLENLIRVWRALHEYVNFVHDPLQHSGGEYFDTD